MRLDLLAVRIQEFRRRFKELSAKEFSDRAITRFIHAAEIEYSRHTRSLIKKRSENLTVSQQIYELNDSIIDIRNVIWSPSVSHRELIAVDWDTLSRRQYTTGNPTHYAFSPTTRRLLFHPSPSAASPTTAINDGGNLSATATSVTVDSSTDFGTREWIKIEDEIIGYTDLTSTTFTGLVR